MKNIVLSLSLAALSAVAVAQENTELSGRVVDANGQPIEGAIVSATGGSTTLTDADGHFSFQLNSQSGTFKVTAEGHYTHEYPLSKDVIPSTIVMVSTDAPRYNGQITMPMTTIGRDQAAATLETLNKKDMSASPSSDLAWQDRVAGLKINRKSGMPDEGGYINIRGLHTLYGDNTPLIVINGVPIMTNTSVSDVINAYSRDALFGYNSHDIRNITVLKGADAALYGSLASNGVILIETEQATSDNLETRVSYSGNFGANMLGKTIPVLGVSDYKSYLMDIGQTRYSSLNTLQADYPFLQNGTNYYSYLFNNNTDWQDQIYRNGFVTDNVIRVEGGDEVAKYNISFGYTNENGTLDQTNSSRFHTAINANIMVSRQFDIFTSVNLAYINSNLNQTGMNEETNPVLAAYHAMPNLSPWQKTTAGSKINKYATYSEWNTNSDPLYAYDNVSNPLAIVKTQEATDKIYDANVRLGLNYRPNQHWTVTGVANIYYDYTEEKLFTPGVSDKAIIPQIYGYGENYVSMGIVRQSTYYFNLNAAYKRVFDNLHAVNAYAGARYMNKSYEYDASNGYNTVNDSYTTLGATTDYWNIYGDNDDWKYVSFYANADYTYNHLWKAAAGITTDATTVSGVDASRFGWFPSASISWLGANSGLLPDCFDLLNVTGEVSLTGNSRFSSNYAKSYYQSQNLFYFGTIVRGSVPNTKLEWEKKLQYDLGFDASLLQNKVNLKVNGFYAHHFDLLLDRNVSAVFGCSEKYYDNTATINTTGVEASLRYNPVNTKDWDWNITANIAMAKSKVDDLGPQSEYIQTYTSYNNDDAETRLKVGEAPYEFYGYKTKGIYATTAEAEAAGLKNASGRSFQGGDVIFVDQDGDGVINDNDRVALGSATPDFYGAFGTSLRWKQFTLSADFGFSVGNKAYNATRRQTESMDSFFNQSKSVNNRWTYEGQQTSMPRAAYGDPSENNAFSDRWIEDASYLKLRNLQLSYAFTKQQARFCSGSVWVAAENLATFTKYLGGDPEFSYSYASALQGFDYAKVYNPVTVKVGVNLNF